MKNIEALQLLNQGERVAMKDAPNGQFYQAYSNEHIFQLAPTPRHSAKVVAVFTPKQFLQTGNIDFIAVDDDNSSEYV